MTSAPESEEAGRGLIGTVVGGRYRVEALIGMGGMGAVYRAEHVLMRKAVAVKVLHREMTLFPEVVARFEREAVAAGRIEHPHVVAATDFGRLDDGAFYMVLEFVEGQSLGAIVKREGALPEERALRIARQIADALSAAHNAGVVHRDLKPENVMLIEREGRAEIVKVLDFGIAKVELGASTEQALTQLGTIFGTPEYMAPEQAQGLAVDARADLYTLGLILYEMLSGASPFRNDELIVVLTRQITVDPAPLPSAISSATQELVSALLKKDPNQRPESAATVRDHLDGLIQGGTPASSVAAASSAALAEPPPPLPAREAVSAPEIALPISAGQTANPSAEPSAGDAAAHANTALAVPVLPAFPGVALAALLDKLRQRGLHRPVAVAGYAVPRWALVASGLVALLVGALTLVLVLVSDDGDSAAPSAGPSAAPAVLDVLAFVAKAEVGDRAALAFLGQRAASDRTLLEWRALGHGWFRAGELKTGLGFYADGLRVKPEIAADPVVPGDVRRAAEHPELQGSALELAARFLGSQGADLLYDFWDEHKNAQNPAGAKRARALLDEEPAKSARSAALDVLLKLQVAMKRPKCGELHKLLPALAEHADARSLPLLTRLTDRRGCGFLGLGDCYSCLRGGKELSQALALAKARPRPSFEVIVPPPPVPSR